VDRSRAIDSGSLSVEFRPAQGPFKQRSWIESQYKLVVYDTREYGELYDLAADPKQERNLYDDPAFRSVREAMEAKYQVENEQPDLVRERMAVA
jgi:arylsulfatase A-like enzyme